MVCIYVFLFVVTLWGINENSLLDTRGASNIIVSKNGFHALFAAYRNNQIDYEKFYPQNSLFIVSLIDDNYTLEFMLTLLNSRLINFVYKINNPQKDKTFAEIKPSVIKILPIKNVSIEKQRPFIDKANEMLNLTKELKGINSKFLRTLERKFDLTGPSKNLQNWQNLTYKEFIKELGKKKIKLAFADEADWEEYFLAEQTRAQALQTKISQTDKEIDNMVYQLYGLTNDEIKIIEDS